MKQKNIFQPANPTITGVLNNVSFYMVLYGFNINTSRWDHFENAETLDM